MRHTSTRPLLATLTTLTTALLLLVGTAGFVPAPAYAATCSATDVTVVVQFPDRTQVGCAKGDPGTGYEALEKAGFGITYAQGNGIGAICRINGYPGDNPCTSMPPSNAYWAYYYAQPGGAWTYSARGGSSRNPKPGDVEGWRFGDGGKWAGTAPAVSTPAPPKPTTKPASKPTKRPTGKPAATTPAATATPRVTAPATATPTGAAADGRSAATAPTTDPSTTHDAGDAAPVQQVSSTAADATDADDADGSGGGLSWVWGLVLLAVLGAAGAGVVVSRRQG